MNREKVMEMAVELGKVIGQDEDVIRLGQLSAAYEENEELKTLMTEYNAQTQVLSMEYAKTEEEKDAKLVEMVQARINELYEQVSNHPLIKEFNEAQQRVNEFMNTVNNEIQFGISGERPAEGGCTHDCSTCGGCH